MIVYPKQHKTNMTRKEAIDILNKSINSGSKIPWDRIVEAVEFAIQALSVSLPSDLDKAAEKHIRKVRDTPGWDWTTQDIAEAFKAGAEWMAEQGATLKVTDDTTWGEVNDYIHRNCDGAKEIQIRKK